MKLLKLLNLCKNDMRYIAGRCDVPFHLSGSFIMSLKSLKFFRACEYTALVFAEILASNNRAISSRKWNIASLGMVSAHCLRPEPICKIAEIANVTNCPSASSDNQIRAEL